MLQLLKVCFLLEILCLVYGTTDLLDCDKYPKATLCLVDVSNESLPVSAEDQKIIVDLHNMYRTNVTPTAKKMMKMAWSDDIAKVAEKWAMQCMFQHDTHAQRVVRGYTGVGQNLLAAHNLRPWGQVVGYWHAEIKDYKYGQKNEAMVGHYTQEVYWGTSKIGCGVAHCPNSKFKYIYACDYLAGQTSIKYPYTSANFGLASCKRTANNTLCDCGGKVCQHGGVLHIDTCKCKCFQLSDGDSCENLVCKKDEFYCDYYPESYCHPKYKYLLEKKCPNKCNSCGNSTDTES